MKYQNEIHKLKLFLKKNISRTFPDKYIKYSFAYGSAVIPQKGNVGSMIDIFLIADNLNEFHRENKVMNKEHYSWFSKMVGLNTLVKLNRCGTGVYYNPTVKLQEGALIKYGVISKDQFFYHLTHWDNFFIAGRFHKPVMGIETDENVENAIEKNREAAFSLCVLKNPQKISKVEFFIDLARISYIGDFRTYMRAEKKDKVKNVVLGAFDEYVKIYNPYIHKYNSAGDNEDFFDFNPDKSSSTDFYSELYNSIPQSFLINFKYYLNLYTDNKDFKYILLNRMNFNDRKLLIDSFLKHLNFKASLYGIMSGIFSTDIHKIVSVLID